MRYPEGYPVGMVTHVNRKTGQHFAQVAVQPSAHLLQSRQVLLVWQKAKEGNRAMQKEVHTTLKKQHRAK